MVFVTLRNAIITLVTYHARAQHGTLQMQNAPSDLDLRWNMYTAECHKSLREFLFEVWERFLSIGLGTSQCVYEYFISVSVPKPSFSLHCESSSLPKHCLEDLVQLYSCLGCDSWEASGIASDTVRLPNPTFSLRLGSAHYSSTIADDLIAGMLLVF